MMRRTIFHLVLAGLVVALAVWLWPRRMVFPENRARYLMNQGRHAEAAERLRKVLRTAPSRAQAMLLNARAELMIGNRAEARRLLGMAPESPDRSWLLAVLEYLEGDDDEALAHLRSLDAPDTVSARPVLAPPLAAALSGRPPASIAAIPEPRRPELERMLWHAITGRRALAELRWEDAARHLAQAEAAGDTNVGTLAALAVAHATGGDLTEAQRVADQHEMTEAFFGKVAGLAVSLSGEATTGVVSLAGAAAAGAERRHLQGARLWAAVASARNAPTTAPMEAALALVDATLVDYPHHMVAGVLRAEALEHLGLLADAYRQYGRLQEWLPTLSASLRADDLAGNTPPDPHQFDWPRMGLHPVAVLAAADFESSAAARRGDTLAFYQQADASAPVTVPADGLFEVTIVARGDTAFGLAPRVGVRMDGRPVGMIYVAREGWDCYPVRCKLTEGTHRLTLAYENNSERLPSNTEDRNFHLHSVIITKAEAH